MCPSFVAVCLLSDQRGTVCWLLPPHEKEVGLKRSLKCTWFQSQLSRKVKLASGPTPNDASRCHANTHNKTACDLV